MPEYRCVVSIRYPSFVTAEDHYTAKDKTLVNLGYELLKNGLTNYIYDIECSRID